MDNTHRRIGVLGQWARKGVTMFSTVIALWRKLTRSRILIGLAFMLISILGVFGVIRSATTGTTVILASRFLAAGTTITQDDIDTVQVMSEPSVPAVDPEDFVGKVIAVDIGDGEMVTPRMIEPTQDSRIALAVPLGIPPATTIVPGSIVTVWRVDEEGVLPPTAVAFNAVVTDIADTGFGADILATLLIEFDEVDRVVAATGPRQHLVLSTGEKS